ncbi:MAG: tetratricopeptide repeat protein [Candidatus Longimicrobiales bacterium M2_2A_002]
MPDPFRPSFWKELRRRRVVRALSVYAVAAWGAVQVADTFFPALRFPDWTVTTVAVLAVLGFPVTVAVAWIYNRTSEGLERTDAVDAGGGVQDEQVRPRVRRQFVYALMLGAVGGMLVVGTVFWLADGPPWAGSPPSGSAVIAVLPFETVGEANPTFTEGIHGDVLTRLSGVPGLDVIARSSVVRYRDPLRPVAEIADELGAGWVLRGEVQQVGEQVQVNARLVDAGRSRQVWAEAFRQQLTAANLFDIQREITRAIVAALQDRLAPGAAGAGTGRGTDDLEAYRLYVLGRGLLGPREEGSMRRAVDYFRRALERDPGYAPAWAGLADALTYLETFGYDLPAVAVDAREAAEQALELDPGLAEAHFALANLAHAERDNPRAIRLLERAIEARPSYSDAFNLLSWIQKQAGLPQQALENAERAVFLDPRGSAPLSNLALARLALGDPVGALEDARSIRDIQPDFATGPFLEALALYHAGRFRETLPLLQNLSVAWAPDAPTALEALTRLALGDTTGARKAARGLEPADHTFSTALIEAAMGNTDAATAAMAGIERWDYWPTFAVRYFFPGVLAPVRADARFDDILSAVRASWR